MDGLVDSSNLFLVEVLDITVFSFDDTVGVNVGLLDGDSSLSAMAFLEAVSVILFSASVEAFGVATEFGSNLSGSSSEVGSHGSLSSFMLSFSNLKFGSSSLEKFTVGLLEVVNISVVFVGKSLLHWLWEFSVIGGASGFIFNASNHNSVGVLTFFGSSIKVSSEHVSVDALGSDLLVAFS